MKLEEMFRRSDRYNFVLNLTPEIATDWIDHSNTHNRKLIEAYVEYLAGEMRAGRWRLTHQGIAFSTNRVLLDGQHRLWACALSGITIPIRVFVNEPPETQQVVDTGQQRRNDQILTLTGGLGEITRDDLATLRSMFLWRGEARRRSPGEEGDMLSLHLSAVRFAQGALRRTNRLRNVATAVTRAVLARAWYSVDHAQLRHFAEVLTTGRPAGEHDGSILLLLQFLIGGGSSKTAADRLEAYCKTERALAAFLSQESLTRLHAATHELFPLPEEAQPTVA